MTGSIQELISSNDTLKFKKDTNTKSKICRHYGEILQKLPYVVYETGFALYILEYTMKPYKKFKRVLFECSGSLFDKKTKDFYTADIDPTIGSLFKSPIVNSFIFFCNKEGLIKLLKRNGLQEKWVLFKLNPRKTQAL